MEHVRISLLSQNPIEPDSTGRSALDYARLYGHEAVVQAILDHVHATDSFGHGKPTGYRAVQQLAAAPPLVQPRSSGL